MKKYSIILSSLMVLLATWGQSQTLADYQFSTGHDGTRWYTLDSTRNLINMTGSRYYRRSSLEEIGFSFPFADTSYTQFSVTHDGNLRLGSELALSSSGNQGSPFVASRAGTNNPKINFMGCAGYSSDTVFVHKQVFGMAPERVLVVEFALQTYVTSSRQSLLRWQVQMHENGDIQIVYPSQAPPYPPYCNHQQGMCVDETDIWIVDENHVATHYTEGYPTHIPGGYWPDTNRYYRFEFPNDVCLTPSNLLAVTLDTLSVTLAWDGDATSYIVEYGSTPLVPGTGSGQQMVVSDTTAYVGGLQAGVQYHFYVRAICGAGDTSNAAYVAARTLTVEPVNMPTYFCDFETADERAGWITPEGNIGVRWYVGNAVNNSDGGQYALYISQDSGATNSCGDNWIGAYAYRSINMEAGDWALSFDWRAYGDWHTNSAGTTTYYQFLRAFLVPSTVSFTTQSPPLFPVPNATPHGTAIPQGWIELNPATHAFAGQSSWTTYSTVVAVGTSGCYNLVFYWETDGYDPPQDLPGAIDNISLERLSCPQPQMLTATTGDDEIMLSWHRGGTESQWRVVCGSIDMTVQDTFCYVSGLEFNTLYHFEVYSICGEGDTSMAVNGSFRTTAGEPVMAYPYQCDFEDSVMTRQWVLLGEDQINAWHIGTAANNTTQGSKGLYVSQDGGLTNSYSGDERALSYAYREMVFDTVEYVCMFDWRCQGDGSFHFFRAFILPAGEVPEAGSFPVSSNLHVSVPTGWIDLNPQGHYFSGQSNWVTYNHTFSVADSGLYALLFMWENDEYDANNPPAAVDNIVIEAVSCEMPAGLAAYAGQTYVDLTWESGNDVLLWVVEYGDTAVSTYVPSLNVEELVPNTEYTFVVRALCSNGDTSLGSIVSIRTSCLPIDTLPFFCDFESYDVGLGSGEEFMPCWWRIRNYGSSYSPQISSYQSVGSRSLYWNLTSGLLDDAIVVLPELAENIEVTYTELRFKAKKYDMMGLYESPVVIVGVMSHPEAASSFSPVDTIVVENTDSFVEYSVPMLSYMGSDQYVAIRCVVGGTTYSSTACYMDDIALYELDYCRKPTSTTVEAGVDTALIAWTVGGDESLWELGYSGMQVTTTEPRYIARGLEADMEYSFAVRSICGAGDTSEALTGRFRTLQPTVDPPEPPDTVGCPDVNEVTATPNYPSDPYQIMICWEGTATAYEVVVSDIEGQYEPVRIVVNDTNCCYINMEGKGSLWAVVVRSVCESGMGEWSDTAYFVTPICIGIDYLTVGGMQVSIYPNPSEGDATVVLNGIVGHARLTIVDLFGRVVEEKDVAPIGTTQIMIRDLARGSYFVRIATEDGSIVKKLVVR